MLRTLLGIGLNNAIPLYLEIEASQIINTLKETTHRLFHHLRKFFLLLEAIMTSVNRTHKQSVN